MTTKLISRRAISAVVLTVVLSTQPGCKWGGQQTAGSSGPMPNQLASQSGPADQSAPPEKFRATFAGKIDGRYDIQMDLERDGGKVKGTYFYRKAGAASIAAKYINLDGTIEADGSASLAETTYDRQSGSEVRSGIFKGRIESANQSLRFTGNWTREKDKRQMPFSLQEVKLDIGEDLRIVSRQGREASKAQSFEIETDIPQLEGNDPARTEKFNKVVEGYLTRELSQFRQNASANARTIAREQPERAGQAASTMEIGHSITASGKDFVSILFSYSFYTGGAHPNSYTRSLNYDLKRNAQLSLADLFLPGADYLKAISDYCIAELKKLEIGDADWIARGAGPDAANYKSWNIAPEGLMITFDSYQVASYAEGPQEVIVPYSVLKPLLRPGGPLAGFVK